MELSLFDVSCGFLGLAPGQTQRKDGAVLTAEQRRVGIDGALVRIIPEEMEKIVSRSNERLYAACEENPHLIPCPVLVPRGADNEPTETEQVADAIRHHAGAGWIRPQIDSWQIASWLSDPLFAAAAERRLPILCSNRLVTFSEMAETAEQFPELPLIIVDVNYRVQRILVALLKRFPNIYLSLGGTYAVQGGLEQWMQEVGETRVLFGTGYPGTETMSAISFLMYSDLTHEQKALIGSGNYQRLKKEIQ